MQTVDLWKYLPPFLKNYLEMVEILKAEQGEFQSAENSLESILKNTFVATASETGIAHLERIMGILPSAESNLETRRANVMGKSMDDLPYTLTALKNRIMQIQGDDNVLVSFSDAYTINITARVYTQDQYDQLNYLVYTMLPANLVVNLSSFTRVTGTLNKGEAIGTAIATMIEVGCNE